MALALSEPRNITVAVSGEHVQDAKALARLAGIEWKAVMAVALARGVEQMLSDARKAAGGGE